jgi:ATP-dependent Clp protease protease subunit
VENKIKNEKFDVSDKLIKSRMVFLIDEINRTSATEVCKQLFALALESNDPIYLHINSGGGFLYQIFAIIDVINFLNDKGCSVYTVANGICASGASLLLCSGIKRYAMSNCRIVIHESTGQKSGRITDLKIEIEESEIVLKKAVEIMSQRTTKSMKVLYKILERNKYMSAQQAMEFGLIDDLFSPSIASFTTK